MKGIYDHYISDSKSSFILSSKDLSFNGRKGEELIDSLNIEGKEKSFISVMIFAFILILTVFLFVDPILANWFALATLILYLLFDMRLHMLIFKLGRSRLLIVRMVTACIMVIAALSYFITEGIREPELIFEDDYFMNIVYDIGGSDDAEIDLKHDMFFLYERIESMEMISGNPEIPFINTVLGIGNRLSGTLEQEGDMHRLLVADKTEEKILLTFEDGKKVYINSQSPEETKEWYLKLDEKIEGHSGD